MGRKRKRMRKVVRLSERYRRHGYYPGRVPEEGAEVVNFAEATLQASRHQRFKKFSDALVSVETACLDLIRLKQKGALASLEPSKKLLWEFMKEIESFEEFLKTLGEGISTLTFIGRAKYTSERMGVLLHDLSFFSPNNTRDVAYTLCKLEERLYELRNALEWLFPPQGITLPEPAYNF